MSLDKFRLPGEAAQIDRIMEAFSKRFFEHSPDCFMNSDAAYVFAFSIIMLNTDLHNPSITKKMTEAGFIKNNRGINDGKNLDEDYILAVYREILNNEIKLKDEMQEWDSIYI